MAIVNGPTLPTNIVKVISNFEILPNSGVIFIDRPTVPNAETVSKTSSINPLFVSNKLKQKT